MKKILYSIFGLSIITLAAVLTFTNTFSAKNQLLTENLVALAGVIDCPECGGSGKNQCAVFAAYDDRFSVLMCDCATLKDAQPLEWGPCGGGGNK
jgi:hypothetical protein